MTILWTKCNATPHFLICKTRPYFSHLFIHSYKDWNKTIHFSLIWWWTNNVDNNSMLDSKWNTEIEKFVDLIRMSIQKMMQNRQFRINLNFGRNNNNWTPAVHVWTYAWMCVLKYIVAIAKWWPLKFYQFFTYVFLAIMCIDSDNGNDSTNNISQLCSKFNQKIPNQHGHDTNFHWKVQPHHIIVFFSFVKIIIIILCS